MDKDIQKNKLNMMLRRRNFFKNRCRKSKVVKTIHGRDFENQYRFGRFREKYLNNFEREMKGRAYGEEKKKEVEIGKNKNQATKGNNWRNKKIAASRNECWSCGKTGHFRHECPVEKGNSM